MKCPQCGEPHDLSDCPRWREQAAQAPIQSGELPIDRYELVETQYGSGYMAWWDKALELDPAGEWCKFADVQRLAAPVPAKSVEPVAPNGYAYRYPDGYIRFTNGESVNGRTPAEAIPYFFGAQSAAAQQQASTAQEQAAIVPAGWKLVPVVPTDDMKDATNLKIGGCYSCSASIPTWGECAEIYADMLAAPDRAPSTTYADCCDTPHLCSAVRRCTAKDGAPSTDSAALVRVARVLADRSADACGVDREDNWKFYSDDFMADAQAAIAASMPQKEGS